MAATRRSQSSSRLPRSRTSLVGREQDIVRVANLLLDDTISLVTLTGPGGVGKTRLALAVADRVALVFPDGTWFVTLDAIRDPDLVLPAIVSTLNIPMSHDQPWRHRLIAFLSSRRALIVVDNLEQVVAIAPSMADLLDECPGLKFLVTSRVPLHIQGEQEYPVAPLGLPDPGTRAMEEIRQSEAVRLFVQRAKAMRPDVDLTVDNAHTISMICRRLDGLPLAIELAASRIRLFSPSALLGRLDHRLPLLSGGPRDAPARQQTIRDTIAWSHDLLSAELQRFFRQLSVFVGGWTVESSEDICTIGHPNDDEQMQAVIDGLDALIDHSMVHRVEQPDGSSRFIMLELVREYAREQLEHHQESDLLHERHATHFLKLVEKVAPRLDGNDPAPVLQQLGAEHDNLRAALRWLYTTSDAERGLSMVGDLREFWFMSGHLSEGREHAALFLDLPLAASSTPERAKALTTAAWLALWQGDAEAFSHAEEALVILRAIGDEEHTPFLLLILGLAVDHFRGDANQGHQFNEESLALARTVGDRKTIALSLHNLGAFALRQGDLDRAQALQEQSMTVARNAGNIQAYALALGGAAWVALKRDDLCHANDMFQERLSLNWGLGDTWGIQRTLQYLAAIACKRQQPDHAVRLLASVDALERVTGIVSSPNDRPFLDAAYSQLVDMLGEDVLQERVAEMRSLPLEDLVDDVLYARSVDPSPMMVDRSQPRHAVTDDVPIASAMASASSRSSNVLSKRERQVLALLVDGKSNQEIANILYISPHTAANHVASIMNKLGVDSRTAAATWAVKHGIG